VAISDVVKDQVQEITEDRLSGAAVLARKTLECYLTFTEVPFQKEDLIELSEKLAQAHPDMAPLYNINHRLYKSENVRQDSEKMLHKLIRSRDEIARKAASLIEEGDTLFTHSWSSTVVHTIELLHQSRFPFHLIVTESQPGGEGKALAHKLEEEGVDVTLIPDSEITEGLSRSQIVFLGADRITPDYFVNKVGTLSVVHCAEKRNIPIYVLADSLKLVPRTFSVAEQNKRYEPTPLDLITEVISE